ncbi:helix-turn-helix domain-containing protein [Marinibacterium sp. SX1]|uniref:helix-turn-helix domain-containing protein n=1 Tax=Marinibacterium sp. SX1 TaxID=3388424 RepID=UPI003D1793F7
MDTNIDHMTGQIAPQAAEAGDYFVYLPESRLCQSWGCTALSTGFTRIAAGSDYPPMRHPDDHHFVWEKGRTLQAYQFAMITEGRGQLAAAPDMDAEHAVEAGDVILLYPGVWHRFAPDPRSGWTENWIECTGTAFDRVMEMGLFPMSPPLWHGGSRVAEIFARIHRLAREDALGNQPALSTLGLQLLAELCQSRQAPERGRSRLVERARRILMETSDRPNALDQVAEELGVSYSTLRRLFRAQTGMSLKRYQDEVRIRRACELLRSSDQSVKEIAGLLGYNSPYHFSSQFRKATGLAPSLWRQRNGPGWLPRPQDPGE